MGNQISVCSRPGSADESRWQLSFLTYSSQVSAPNMGTIRYFDVWPWAFQSALLLRWNQFLFPWIPEEARRWVFPFRPVLLIQQTSPFKISPLYFLLSVSKTLKFPQKSYRDRAVGLWNQGFFKSLPLRYYTLWRFYAIRPLELNEPSSWTQENIRW